MIQCKLFIVSLLAIDCFLLSGFGAGLRNGAQEEPLGRRLNPDPAGKSTWSKVEYKTGAVEEAHGVGAKDSDFDRRHGGRLVQEQDGSWSLHRSAMDHCWSKTERSHYHKRYKKHPSPAFIDKVQRYESMHQQCTQPDILVASFSEEHPSKGSLPLACQYVIHKGSGGLGNQMQGLLSTFLFALLTNRALIVPHKSDASLLCEPFTNSSWMLGRTEEKMVMAGMKEGNTDTESLQKAAAQGEPLRNRASLYLEFDAKRGDEAFFCESAQAALRNTTWLQLRHARYFAPALMALPSFRAKLERLFPDRMIFTQLARYLLHPKNVLWDKITRVYHAHLRHADRHVGIQVRTFADKDEWADQRVLNCAWNISKLLPPPIMPELWSKLVDLQIRKSRPIPEVAKAVENHSPQLVKVFVASIHAEHVEVLRRVYEDGIAADGSTVAFHSQPSVVMERWSLDQHALAVVDTWLLSFCDELLTSSQSTLGRLAAGLAGVRPFVLNIAQHEYGWRKTAPEAVWRTNGKPVCTLAPSADPCGLPALKRPCTISDASDQENATTSRPTYVQECATDLSFYWQILSDESQG